MKKMNTKIVSNQLAVLELLQEFKKEYGYSPTQREISHNLDIPRKTVGNNLKRLEERGLISRNYGMSRGVMVNSTEGLSVLPVCEWKKKNASWGSVKDKLHVPEYLAPKQVNTIAVISPEYFATESVMIGDKLIVDIAPEENVGLLVLWSSRVGKRIKRVNAPIEASGSVVLGKILNVIRTF